MRSILVAILILFTAAPLYAQQINLKVGDEFSVESTINRVVTIPGRNEKGDETYKFQFKTLSSNADGYKFQCTLLKNKINTEREFNNHTFKFDSDSLRNTKMRSSAILTPFLLLQQPFTVWLSPKGKLLKLEGVDELRKEAFAKWKVPESTAEWFEKNLTEELSGILSKMFFEMPVQKIAYLSEWTDSAKATYKVTAVRGALLDITASKPNNEFQAKYSFNEANGLLENATSTGKTIISIGVFNTTYSHHLTYGKSTAPAVDTAWINMAVLMNWSDAFYTLDRKVDSIRAMVYFNTHDAQFANDKVYNAQKLYLAQHLTGVADRKFYNYTLARMPNAFIADETSYLFNKLRDMMKMDADSAYSVIKYYAKHPEFASWLQGNLANSFLRGDHIDISRKVLAKLIADKSMHLEPNLVGLNLWVALKDTPYNTDLLLKTYNKFLTMNDEYMQKGNGPRYALLTYKMLLKANKQTEAANLLKKTMQNLERYAADTLNQRRLVDKNKLAYVNFLMYQANIKTDSVAAMQYFAKAAELSPASRSEWSYTGYNDHDYLQSKMSYREDYIKKLFANGPNDAALKLFVDVVNSNVSQIDEMRKIFESSVKDKSFAHFFKNNVVSTWQDAPDFELLGVDGKKYKLSDYRGKWLVIDFWGTWCGPCRSEMPRIDKFNTDVNAGKFKGVNFLSIACYDKDKDVKSYLEGTGFGIPVAMGDAKLIKDYNLTAFPTKMVISPNGKMTSALHGSTGSATVIYMDLSWENIVNKLSTLYAAN